MVSASVETDKKNKFQFSREWTRMNANVSCGFLFPLTCLEIQETFAFIRVHSRLLRHKPNYRQRIERGRFSAQDLAAEVHRLKAVFQGEFQL